MPCWGVYRFAGVECRDVGALGLGLGCSLGGQGFRVQGLGFTFGQIKCPLYSEELA